MGRPTDFSDELANRILERLADGDSLRKICAGDDMPNRSTVFRWLAAQAEFRDLYALARECQADAYADDVVALADQVLEGKTTIEKQVAVSLGNNGGSQLQDTTETRTSDAVDRSKLMVDARKWAAAKLAPKKYGEKLELSGNVRHEDALDELERLEEAARAAAAPPAQE
jgi:hypothetical protein